MGGSVLHKATYQTWQDMKQRCYNPKCHNYKNYGTRGITVCDRWLASFGNFLADMGERPKGLTIERKDTDGNYEPSNCKWANRAEQRRNQRDCINLTHNGRTMTLEEWGRELGRHPTTLRARIRQGFPAHLILEPTKIKRRFWSAAIAKEKK